MKNEKIKDRESKQLTRLNKTRTKGNYKGYFFVLLFHDNKLLQDYRNRQTPDIQYSLSSPEW